MNVLMMRDAGESEECKFRNRGEKSEKRGKAVEQKEGFKYMSTFCLPPRPTDFGSWSHTVDKKDA